MFNEVSGATHLLTPEALVVLQHMGAGPVPESALAAVLRERFEVDDATLVHDVAELLEQLSCLNLIEPCLLEPIWAVPNWRGVWAALVCCCAPDRLSAESNRISPLSPMASG